MAYTTLTEVMAAIAADAGQNSATAPQTAFTLIGEIEAARREGPPRVLWLAGGGPITDPDQDESELGKIGYQRNLRCSVTFLGATYDQAELLLHNFLAAVRRTQQGTVVPGAETTTPENIASAARHAITIELTVYIPVPFEVYTASDVDSASQTGTVI